MQRRTLIRARTLAAFRRALVELAGTGSPLSARRRVVIVPTRASAELLRQTIEQHAARDGRAAFVLPDVVTRDDWWGRLHGALSGAAPMLSRLEREVLLARAAIETTSRRRTLAAPFEIRPGLVAAMLDFYDELKRRQRTVRRFARALFDDLRVERGTDRGSESLIQQTRFLGLTFLAYERLRAASGSLDEHALRAKLLDEQPPLDLGHLVVAVADHPSDPRGLWPADFDLVGRLRHLARVDVVVTDEVHDAGFRERVERELPGIVEQRAEDAGGAPRLIVPDREAEGGVFVSRDREEEVRDVARAIRAAATIQGDTLAPTAVVFHRPLPYLYLAQQVLTDARIPYQAFDALPLAGEPYAALLDLVMTMARTGGTREAAIALLRSPLLSCAVDGERVGLRDAAALDRVLVERRVTGEASTWVAEVEAFGDDARGSARTLAVRATRAARGIDRMREALVSFRDGLTASAQVEAIAGFLRAYERDPHALSGGDERYLRARAAVLGTLDALAEAFRRFGDAARHHEALAALIHHAIEARTFTPRRGDAGVHLIDAVAARFGEFDHVYVVGLVETDWPRQPRRTLFYTSGLLKALGWPQDADHAVAQQAIFRDLLGLARQTTRLSAFQFEGDALLALSPLVGGGTGVFSTETGDSGTGLPGADARGRPVPESPVSVENTPVPPLFSDELLTGAGGVDGLDAAPAAWLALRRGRPWEGDRAYGGFVGPQAPRAYSVSRVDHYVDCPFKYFAENVLKLPEEYDQTSGLTPLERGSLLHELFERFYRTWQDEGRGAITPASLPDALALFTRLTHEALDRLPAADRALEETRLLGSIVARGVAERVFELEADAGVGVRARLLEHTLSGTFTFPACGGFSRRDVEIRGKADRIDVLENGSLRVVDYKLGRLPDLETSVQIAVYAHCAQQMLEAEDAASHPVSAAMYLAFGDDRRLEGTLGRNDEHAAMAVAARAAVFADTVGDIEAGKFPPAPKRPGECAWCRFAGVCRKEYLVDADESAEPV